MPRRGEKTVTFCVASSWRRSRGSKGERRQQIDRLRAGGKREDDRRLRGCLAIGIEDRLPERPGPLSLAFRTVNAKSWRVSSTSNVQRLRGRLVERPTPSSRRRLRSARCKSVSVRGHPLVPLRVQYTLALQTAQRAIARLEGTLVDCPSARAVLRTSTSVALSGASRFASRAMTQLRRVASARLSVCIRTGPSAYRRVA